MVVKTVVITCKLGILHPTTLILLVQVQRRTVPSRLATPLPDRPADTFADSEQPAPRLLEISQRRTRRAWCGCCSTAFSARSLLCRAWSTWTTRVVSRTRACAGCGIGPVGSDVLGRRGGGGRLRWCARRKHLSG